MVFPIKNTNKSKGSRALVGNHLITVNYAIYQTENPYMLISGKTISLDNLRKIKLLDNNDEDRYNLAIYNTPEAKSNLVLSNRDQNNGEKLENISFKMSNSTSGYTQINCIAYRKRYCLW